MESVASPPDTPQQQAAPLGKASASERTVHSRLHAIVMQHLRHQHKAACLRSAAPISTLPPMSLLRPKSLPQVACMLSPHMLPCTVCRRALKCGCRTPTAVCLCPNLPAIAWKFPVRCKSVWQLQSPHCQLACQGASWSFLHSARRRSGPWRRPRRCTGV